jgi:uncharacterized protein YcbK (DUF882 family)
LSITAHALPVAAVLFLVSCTSTGSSLDVASAGLQPALTAPAPTNAQQLAANGVVTAATTQNAPSTTLGLNTQQQPALPNASTNVAATPEATQIDNNSKLVAAAALAASSNATLATPAPSSPAAVATAPAVAPVIAVADPAAQVLVAPVAVTPTQLAPPTNQALKQQTATAVAATQTELPPANGAVLTATPAQQILTAAPAAPAPVKKKSLFDSLFASNKKSTTPSIAEATAEPTQLALAAPTPPLAKKAKVTVEPVLQPAKLDLTKLEEPQASTSNDAPAADNGELPGVRKGALFEIKRRDSIQDDTDVDIGETDSGPVLLASAAGLARLAPNGLKVQRESVDVACLKPQLVKILKKIESHYRSTVVVTSGFRSPTYNRRVRGAKNSLHMFCAAADIQVVGVGKWELARYARSMQGRGGVGTYCHTDSIHIDVGPDRDWNWRCSRRK